MVLLPVGYVKEGVTILYTLQHTVFIIEIQLQVGKFLSVKTLICG